MSFVRFGFRIKCLLRCLSEPQHTERPTSVANSHQNHFSTVGNLATKDLEVLTLPALTFYNHTININNEESALSFHLSKRLTNTNAAFTIINGLTISFVSDANDNIILMYSHFHLPKGAFLAQSQRSDIEELLNWLKLKLSATVNLCAVTFINFR